MIPEKFVQSDPELVELILISESMNDGEKQYWFNLTEVMNEEQTEKLRDILTRERDELDRIDKKYAQKAAAQSPEEEEASREEAIAAGEKRAKARAELRAREDEVTKEEQESADDILSELDEV